MHDALLKEEDELQSPNPNQNSKSYTYEEVITLLNIRNPVTPFGWKIKEKLVERQMDQRTFCDTYHIPASRLSNLIHGTRKAKKYRVQVSQLLGIEE